MANGCWKYPQYLKKICYYLTFSIFSFLSYGEQISRLSTTTPPHPHPVFFFNPFETKLMFPGCTGFQGLLYKKIYSWVWKYSKVSTKEFSTVRQTCNREVSCHTKWQDVRKEVKYWQDWCCHMEEESKKLQEIAKNKRTCHEMLRTLLEDKRSS